MNNDVYYIIYKNKFNILSAFFILLSKIIKFIHI